MRIHLGLFVEERTVLPTKEPRYEGRCILTTVEQPFCVKDARLGVNTTRKIIHMDYVRCMGIWVFYPIGNADPIPRVSKWIS